MYTATVAGPSATPEAVAAADAAVASQSPTNAAASVATGEPPEEMERNRTDPTADVTLSSMLQSFSPFHKKNNRSPSFVSLLHSVRVALLGSDESTPTMQGFRRVQTGVWRLYKYLLRRMTHTGELERMISEANLTMVPLGSCLEERVGFHPHLVTLAVRISAYLRSSKQLAEVLALEEETAAQERIARVAAAASGGAASQGGPADGDEDETPMSTPSISMMAPLADPSPLSLSGSAPGPSFAPRSLSGGMPTGPAFSPILAAARSSMAAQNSSTVAASSSSSSSSAATSTYAPSFLRPFSGRGVAPPSMLPSPPLLHLSSSDADHSVSSAAAQDARASHLLQLLVAVKHINRTSSTYSNLLRPVLYRSLIYRNDIADFLRFELAPVLAIPYSESNPRHEAWLQELWELYLPLGPKHKTPPERRTKAWGLLGFQGDNPATDFRAMGILGLRNLMEFGRACPIQANLIMRRSHEENQGLKWFGLAITGINLTSDLVRLSQNHELDAFYFTYGANWASWHALYSTMLIKFDELWQEVKPESVMAFSSIHSSFLHQFACEARSFPFSHRAVASDSFKINAVTPITPRIVNLVEDGEAAGDSEEEEDFGIQGAQRVTERTVLRSRRGSRSANNNAAAASWSLSRSTSPLSHYSASQSLASASSNSASNSPLSPMSRSQDITDGGVAALGNMLDPIVTPAQFAQFKLPPWTD